VVLFTRRRLLQHAFITTLVGEFACDLLVLADIVAKLMGDTRATPFGTTSLQIRTGHTLLARGVRDGFVERSIVL
jgi:hypothetical protein